MPFLTRPIVFLFLTAVLLAAAEPTSTLLGIDHTRFTVNGRPAFLLGISYYGGLGAPEEFVRHDLDDVQKHGFNWLRVWATWRAFGDDVSVVDAHGEVRERSMNRLKWLMEECDRRRLIVDVTLTRGAGGPGSGISDFESHQRAVENIVRALRDRRNWYLDLGNERDVRDNRFVPVAELKALREAVRKLDPQRLVTASFGGNDLTKADLRDALVTARLDFIAPHRPRDANSPAQTEAKTRSCLEMMKSLGREAPIHYQEPFRRGYTDWEPKAADFLADLRGAIAGGAGGWCFHNGQQRGAPGNRPRRSFDLRAQRLFDQLDAEEWKVVEQAARELSGGK